MTINTRKLSSIVEERNSELESKYETLNTTGVVEADYISTGLTTLDELGMVEVGILTAIAGHTGDGKTAVAMQLLESCSKQGYKPISCTFEDPGKFVSDRLTARELGESAFRLRKLAIEDEKIGLRLRSATSKISSWAQNVTVIEDMVPVQELLDYFDVVVSEATGLISIDYAQAFDSEPDEKSVERVVARLAWGCNQLAKRKNVAVVLYSQIKSEVLSRGKRQYDNWMFTNKKEPGPSDYAAVEGYRPLNGDMQWSTALGQRCKQSIMLFRPGNWLKTHGVSAKDDVMHVMADKGNYSPSKQIKVLGFHGPTARIYDKVKK
jgi:replicative DNA helicase